MSARAGGVAAPVMSTVEDVSSLVLSVLAILQGIQDLLDNPNPQSP